MSYKEKLAKYKNKKKRKIKPSVINLLINLETNPVKLILLKNLKKLNKIAYTTMMTHGVSFKDKYHILQKLPCWKQAKHYLIQFKDDLRCELCKSNVVNDFVLHHKEYKVTEIFTPTLINLVHNSCHRKYHKK